ncbi:MAG: peptide chain release factor N(5)-glutamine methyltransferase [Candidatus Dadabacteria bacterium]|nr:peptide chain release factor N(5)-glutamine methyltransferase [Candidatus Dadabacteria bacterium]NIX15002.1 peptide chain release factor N(5)-glutamine methyltransferase [Candidatus Dadabacteria bacterium]
MNIKELYNFGRKTLSDPYFKNPGLEASLLLHAATGVDKLAYYKDQDRFVSSSEIDKYKELLQRRLSNEPIAYILGKKEFYSREFIVDTDVIIPRPETEVLVEQAIKLAKEISHPYILDIGTGSGCIGVTIKAEVPNCVCIATDISAEALHKAKHNSKLNKANPLFIKGSLLECISNEKFDIVVSNPPYVKEEDFINLDKGVKNYEPIKALVADSDGFSVINRIIVGSKRVLKNNGWCILEVGYDQAEHVIEIFELNGYKQIEQFKDLSGIVRVVKAKWTN